ncbi:MAG: hypothetical protein JHC97_14415, partial [Brevundimonas sp.]|nr:hypothetical protein [Brevundimonas sp.]
MSIRPLALAAVAAAALSACAPTTFPAGAPTGGPAAFNAADFAWSQRTGQAAIEGRVAYNQDGKSYACVASAGLTPDTPLYWNTFRERSGAIYALAQSAGPEPLVAIAGFGRLTSDVAV